MGYKSLELTLISARDLKNVNFIGKMDVYVVVFLSGDPRTKQKTPVHQDGGTSPRWNYTMRFTIDDATAISAGLMVVFQLKHEHTFGPDKDLGEVRIPVKDLLDGFRPNKDAQVTTYQVRRPSGKPKGELKFSYKVNDVVYNYNYGQPKVSTTVYPVQSPASSSAEYPPPPIATAYPPPPPPSAYPPSTATAYPPPPKNAYPPPIANAYPPPPSSAYPTPTATAYPAYPPQATAYPYIPPQQAGGYGYGYGYPVQGQQPQSQSQRPRKNGGFGMGMGAGLLGGALGGLLIGDMVSDVYDDGYDAGAADFDMDF